MEQMKDKEQQPPFNFGLVSSSSSSSASYRIFFNPTQDHMGFYHPQLYHPQVENGVKLRVWKKAEDEEGGVKWMRKKQDRVGEVKKVMPSSSVETDLSSSYTPIRVCSDCHTTKTPLWRSGPKGPKSLCNACGIRQRKARRAMAAAANGGGAPSPSTKLVVKEKMGKSGLKKRSKLSGGSSSGKKMDFEDFLINLSNKLAIHRVFPQDEKEAAILLMALSSGLVHA
ncbi:GATA transcription factor 21-like isoform X2 [Salvia miltiorrhiza]|uniref:GATA transcription factor 21-like isoform X2 n=1 Tax=Salvia miltiorrhiza TaxID=226208 RepID=UPI0025AD5F76|nr:GATA transcription factor 21-like isoform X2 [Salvia miltiorrhiza]XP_057787656.1 GATA transcription factor 21-like isoform X2 [Salvia miltiorrhiza]